MEINTESLEIGPKQIIAAVLILLTTFLWTFFLASTGIVINDFFTFQMDIVAGKLLTINTLLFFITLPIPITVMAIFAKRMDKANLMIVSLISTLLAVGAAMILFKNLQDMWILGVFYIISLPFAIETAFVKYSELEHWISLRTSMSSASRMIIILSLGLFVLSAITIFPNQDAYIDKFESFIEDFALSATSEGNMSAVPDSATDVMVVTQLATIDSIMGNQVFENLRRKEDPEVLAFVVVADTARDYLQSPEYRASIEKQIREASTTVVEEIDIIKIMKEEFPLFETMEEFLWLTHAIGLLGIFSFIASMISKPTAAGVGAVGEAIFSFTEEQMNPGSGKKKKKIGYEGQAGTTSPKDITKQKYQNFADEIRQKEA